MKLSDQCCTREQAQRLKELGVAQKGHFLWQWEENPQKHVLTFKADPDNHAVFEQDCQAFSAAELGQMLPDYTGELGNLEIGKSETDHISMKPKKEKWWNVSYWTLSGRVERDLYIPEQKSKHLQQAATLAQTLAKMLIYLLENNLLSVSEVNERLKGQTL